MLVCGTILLAACSGNNRYHYETTPGDPMNVQTYKLKNGLTVSMTVNKEQPRIQTYIAVRTGSKNDPAETTGLAHYLEHLMFKGTTQFGTQTTVHSPTLLPAKQPTTLSTQSRAWLHSMPSPTSTTR